MLRNTHDLEDYVIRATDGPIGHVKDFYFDDDAWVVRYFIVETGSWLSSRSVLISPISVHHPDWNLRTLPVSITKEQVKNCPDIDTDKPVSRQNEEKYMDHYGYPNYWDGLGVWGGGMYPYAMVPSYAGNRLGVFDQAERDREEEAHLRAESARRRNNDPHLRSCKAVTGYHIEAKGGEIGHVAGYLVDDETWAVLYLIIDTSNWWMGHQVLIAPAWITGVSWNNKTVSVKLSRESVKSAPVYDPDAMWSRELDRSLYQHYGQTGTWSGSALGTDL